MIKYVILDVDGTLTDGGIFYDDIGREVKRFSVKDGIIISEARKYGLKFIVITGRKSKLVEQRMQELKVEDIFQGVTKKDVFLQTLISERKLDKEEVAYIGDDLNDLKAMKLCGFKACPQDACKEIKQIADYIADCKGGFGAVRDIVEHILKLQGKWEQLLAEL